MQQDTSPNNSIYDISTTQKQFLGKGFDTKYFKHLHQTNNPNRSLCGFVTKKILTEFYFNTAQNNNNNNTINNIKDISNSNNTKINQTKSGCKLIVFSLNIKQAQKFMQSEDLKEVQK